MADYDSAGRDVAGISGESPDPLPSLPVSGGTVLLGEDVTLLQEEDLAPCETWES